MSYFTLSPSCVSIFSMTEREELFTKTEEKIEETTKLLRAHFYDLGLTLFRHPDILPSQMGVSLNKAAAEAEKAMKESEGRLDKNKEFTLEYDQRKERKLLLDDESERIRGEEKEIRLRLGALIYEQCSLDLLPRDKFSAIYLDSDEEKSLNENAISRSFWKRIKAASALNVMHKNAHNRYLDYSSFADSDDCAILISGQKAHELISALRDVETRRKENNTEQSDLEGYLSENLQRRKGLSKSALEDEKIDVEEKETAFRECIINYGNYLYDRGGSWIDEKTPPDVLDIVQAILENQKAYSSLNSERSRIEKEAKADDYKALIESEKEKIRILEEEKRKIDDQISGIEKEIERLESLVERIFKNQDRF